MSSSDKDFCIRCDRGGKMLVCSESSCPLAVHEKCLGYPAKFDDRGNFYCPFCVYRLATAEARKAREEAMLQVKAVSSFLGDDVINMNKLVQPSAGESSSKRADESSLGEHIDVLRSKCTNDSRDCTRDSNSMALGHQTLSGDEPRTRQTFRTVQVGKGMQTAHEPVVDDQQLDGGVENQEDGRSREIPEREKKNRKKRKVVIAATEPEVVGQLQDGDVDDHQEDGCLSEKPEKEQNIRKKPKLVIAANGPVVDDQEVDIDAEGHLEFRVLSDIPERGKEISKKPKLVIAANVPEIDDQQLDRDVEDHQEGGHHWSEIPERENKSRKTTKVTIAENERQLDREIEDHQEDGHLSDIPERVKKIVGKAKLVIAANELEVDDQQLDGDVEDSLDRYLREISERGKKLKSNGKQIHAESEPEVHVQRPDGDVEDHQGYGLNELPEREKEIRKIAEQILSENEPEVDEHLREVPEREENTMEKTIQKQAERKEKEAFGAEAEHMQGKVHQPAASCMNEEPEPELPKKPNKRDKTIASTSRGTVDVSRGRKHAMGKNGTEDRPLNSDPKSRSTQTARTTRRISGIAGETSSPGKLKLAVQDSTWRLPVSNGRRKKLAWSEEEEDMLREAVPKFSKANKNIPWRKILEFGRHVFDSTRTPVDLKDKWRTMFPK